jgi:hypothetical protein
LALLGAARADEVLTQRNDNQRTGSSTWPGLNQSTVKGFQLQAILKVDGPVTAQPLFAEGVQIGGKTRSVIFVATATNKIVAFDADPPFQVLWKHVLPRPWAPDANQRVELGGKREANGVITGGYSQMVVIGAPPHDQPILGIESTPVIDRAHRTA